MRRYIRWPSFVKLLIVMLGGRALTQPGSLSQEETFGTSHYDWAISDQWNE